MPLYWRSNEDRLHLRISALEALAQNLYRHHYLGTPDPSAGISDALRRFAQHSAGASTEEQSAVSSIILKHLTEVARSMASLTALPDGLPADPVGLSQWLTAAMNDGVERRIDAIDFIAGASDVVQRLWMTGPIPEDRDGLSTSYILKRPSDRADRRQLSSMLHMFDREALFYSTIALEGTIPAPKAHVIDPTLQVFLLEDMGLHQAGDLVDGYTAEEGRSTVSSLLAFHKAWAGADALGAFGLPSPLQSITGLPPLLQEAIEAIHQPVLSTLSPRFQRVITALPGRLEILATALSSEPTTLLHGDLHVGNILYSTDSAVAGVIDWQLMAVGSPMIDLAYFLVQSGQGEDREQVEPWALNQYGAWLQLGEPGLGRLHMLYRFAVEFSVIIPIFSAVTDLKNTGILRDYVPVCLERLDEAVHDHGIG